MKILIASDHAGLDLKDVVVAYVRRELKHDCEDLGTHTRDSCDYPEYAVRVARAVAAGEADFGILVCGTGIGMSVAANKVPGAVAALCSECYSARAARAHNDANALCLGGRVVGAQLACDVVRAFLATAPEDAPRLVKRREQIRELDKSLGADA